MGTSCDASDKEKLHQKDSGERLESGDTSSLWQTHYLTLLESRMNLKSSYQDDPDHEAWLLNAINKAVYSAFRSCVEHGVEAEAKALIKGGQEPS